jgi:hypothetical protein
METGALFTLSLPLTLSSPAAAKKKDVYRPEFF